MKWIDRPICESIEGAREFLNGKNSKILGRLKERMLEASEALNFEEAAQYRDYIEAAKALSGNSARRYASGSGYRHRDPGQGTGRGSYGHFLCQGRQTGGTVSRMRWRLPRKKNKQRARRSISQSALQPDCPIFRRRSC